MLTKNIHYSPDLEAAVLGACLLESTAFGRTHDIIDQEVFYSEANQQVYQSIKELYSTGLPLDVYTVVDHLAQRGIAEVFGGYNTPYYMTVLTKYVISTAHLEYHSYVLKRMWMEREVIKLTHGFVELEGDVSHQLIQLQTAIARIKSGEFVKDWYDMSELMIGLIKHQESIEKGEQVFIKTGIPKLDEINGGFYAGQSIVIGARPGAGKSAFMGQMALSVAKQGKTVGIISLEMSNNEIAGRLASLDTEIEFKAIYRNLFFDENQRQYFYERAGKMVNIPLYVSDATKVNPVDIRAKADKLRRSKGLDVLFIDYLQLISADQPANKNRENIVSEISRATKIMAKELNVPVVTLCQLNRASTSRGGESRYPQLSDLRESGSIEQDADVVMFIHRDWAVGVTTDDTGESTENKADILVRKWRNGEANLHIPVGFNGPKMSFTFEQKSNWKRVGPDVDYSGDNPF